MFSSILVPVDFSDGANHALRLAIRVARASKGSITLLHVGMAPGVPVVDTYGVPVPPIFPEMVDDFAKERRHAIDRLAREEIPEDVPWRAVVRDGYPPEEIVAEAGSDAGYDLLVMGTHGRTGLARVVLGSVTERVLRSCPIPVLVTK